MFIMFISREVLASGDAVAAINPSTTFLWIAIVLVAAKVSSIVERFGQPSVLGEMIIGVVIGNLALFGINFFEPIKNDVSIAFLAELGAVILLFQIGLESNIQKLCQVGWRAFAIAFMGIISTFILITYIAGPIFLKGLSFNSYMFLGATLTATSVGIAARVFRDMKKTHTPEAQMVLGAAVIDDVLGLIIIAIASSVVTAGTINIFMIGTIVLKAVAFLVGAVIIGQIIAPKLGNLFSKINTSISMKFTFAVSFGLILASIAPILNLAPIIGAFAAGLILDPVHFRFFENPKIINEINHTLRGISRKTKEKFKNAIVEPYAHRHIEEVMEPLGYFLVPIFFVMIGIHVKLESLLNPATILIALAFSSIAFVGKLSAGLVAGGSLNRSVVGWGMVPRGEVVLIAATIGKTSGVITDQMFSIIIAVVILSTLIPPIVLAFLLKSKENQKIPAMLKLKHHCE